MGSPTIAVAGDRRARVCTGRATRSRAAATGTDSALTCGSAMTRRGRREVPRVRKARRVMACHWLRRRISGLAARRGALRAEERGGVDGRGAPQQRHRECRHGRHKQPKATRLVRASLAARLLSRSQNHFSRAGRRIGRLCPDRALHVRGLRGYACEAPSGMALREEHALKNWHFRADAGRLPRGRQKAPRVQTRQTKSRGSGGPAKFLAVFSRAVSWYGRCLALAHLHLKTSFSQAVRSPAGDDQRLTPSVGSEPAGQRENRQ